MERDLERPSSRQIPITRRHSLFIAGSILCGASSLALAQARQLAEFGIVLMSGKGGPPGIFLANLAALLRDNGAIVVLPGMPWQGSHGRPRGYMESYDQAMERIDGAVRALRSRGAKRIVVGGQSMGANAALGYAARRGNDLAGIIALAAGHVPEFFANDPEIAKGLAKAKQLVAAGRGDVPTMLPDSNQGKKFQVPAKPSAYVSYFDPHGPAVMPRNAAAMPPIPLLWVTGRREPYPRRQGYAFVYAPQHPKSQYLEVDAGHLDTPDVARRQVVEWLRTL
jgi:pimeloyl-ACP methyl ester carboxylesterase